MAPRLKVLLSAYACEPGKGSEPGKGWNWVKQIAGFHDVWVITRANNRTAIEQGQEKEPLPHAHWVYYDLRRWARFWKKGQRGLHLYYYLWQIGAYFVGKQLYRQIQFDLVHHVSFGNYWLPSFLALLPVSFVWGPVGGGESAPKTFYKTFGVRGWFFEHLRDVARWLAERDPFVRLTRRKARIVLATTTETANRLKKLGVKHVKVLTQVSLPASEFHKLNALSFRNTNPFRLFSVGRLLHWKGFDLGLMAFARFQHVFLDSEYWLIGDGPHRKQLQRLVRKLGVADKVHFWGSMPRVEVLERLANGDVLVHPSLHDSGGWVSLEAMAAGKPVICLDLGGPALQVTEETGFRISPHTPDKVVDKLADAMVRLARDAELRKRMGEAGRRRVAEYFIFEQKSDRIRKLYEQTMTQ